MKWECAEEFRYLSCLCRPSQILGLSFLRLRDLQLVSIVHIPLSSRDRTDESDWANECCKKGESANHIDTNKLAGWSTDSVFWKEKGDDQAHSSVGCNSAQRGTLFDTGRQQAASMREKVSDRNAPHSPKRYQIWPMSLMADKPNVIHRIAAK